MVRPAICAALSAALVEGVGLGLRGSLRPVLLLAVGIAAGGAGYVVLLRALARTQYHEALHLLARLLQRQAT